jgi:putative iron-dependent peroxidase
MPFGAPGSGEFGTYFIGYARSPDTTEQMLRNMFIGLPEGNYDRLLDFSTAVTGNLFFVPSATMLESLGDGPLAGGADTTGMTDTTGTADGSLRIGSLRGASPDE